MKTGIRIDNNGFWIRSIEDNSPIVSFTRATSLCGRNLFEAEIDRYIINEGATIIFWDDGDKTISKRHKDDKFDKELGFLFAYFYKKWGVSKAARKRIIESIDYKNIKTFLFEFYVKDSGKTTEQAKKFLKNLEVSK